LTTAFSHKPSSTKMQKPDPTDPHVVARTLRKKKPVDRDDCVKALARIKASPDMDQHDAERLTHTIQTRMPRTL
jgi:hypothetical protein